MLPRGAGTTDRRNHALTYLFAGNTVPAELSMYSILTQKNGKAHGDPRRVRAY